MGESLLIGHIDIPHWKTILVELQYQHKLVSVSLSINISLINIINDVSVDYYVQLTNKPTDLINWYFILVKSY